MRIAFLIILAGFLIEPLNAKRINPQPVSPVISNGVEYSADGDGRTQYVVATDTRTSTQLWRIKIFRTHIKPWIEEDNQWVFITKLTLKGNTLVIRDEKNRCYGLNLATKRVKNEPVLSIRPERL